MRYTISHKDETRQHIIDVASRLFKEKGIDATGVAVVMKKAGLTNGAFYAHFASKEALVEAVVVSQLDYKLKTFWDMPKVSDGLETIINLYLSPEHRDDFADGCPSAALQDEIARRPESTRNAYSKGVLREAEKLQEYLPAETRQPYETALALMSLLVGTLQFARTMTDETTSLEVLKSGRLAAATLISSSKN